MTFWGQAAVFFPETVSSQLLSFSSTPPASHRNFFIIISKRKNLAQKRQQITVGGNEGDVDKERTN